MLTFKHLASLKICHSITCTSKIIFATVRNICEVHFPMVTYMIKWARQYLPGISVSSTSSSTRVRTRVCSTKLLRTAASRVRPVRHTYLPNLNLPPIYVNLLKSKSYISHLPKWHKIYNYFIAFSLIPTYPFGSTFVPCGSGSAQNLHNTDPDPGLHIQNFWWY